MGSLGQISSVYAVLRALPPCLNCRRSKTSLDTGNGQAQGIRMNIDGNQFSGHPGYAFAG